MKNLILLILTTIALFSCGKEDCGNDLKGTYRVGDNITYNTVIFTEDEYIFYDQMNVEFARFYYTVDCIEFCDSQCKSYSFDGQTLIIESLTLIKQ